MNGKPLKGIHHVSAITANAKRNYDFYTNILGLRLVKKTVNQDDTSVYHLFYGDERGNPGTEFTFFEIPYAGRPIMEQTALRQHRCECLPTNRCSIGKNAFKNMTWMIDISEQNGRAALSFRDFEGQRLVLVSDEHHAGIAGGRPWDKIRFLKHTLFGDSVQSC